MIRLNFSLLFLICTTLSSCWNDKLELISNAAYAIGTVDYYNPVGGVSSGIHFHYSIDKMSYSVNYSNGNNRWNVPWSCGNCTRGNKFMVQYDSLSPNVARMLFSYPVVDSSDYKKYVALFKKNPPAYPSP